MTRRPLLAATCVLAALSVSACGDNIWEEGSLRPACAAGRAPPSECVTWTADNGPYTLHESVVMDSLTIEPGTIVYAAPSVSITVMHLVINGTAEQPVLLLPLDETAGWRGLVVRGGLLRHVTIERAAGYGLAVGGTTLIEDITIRDSGGGISVGGLRMSLRIAGGTIENNAAHGISAFWGDQRSPTVIFDAPVRITGNGGYPLHMIELAAVRGVMSEPAAQQGLLGNGSDTIVAHTGFTWRHSEIPAGDLVLRPELPVQLQTECLGSFIPPMTLQPGASLTLHSQSICPVAVFGLPTVHGTEDDPATIRAGVLTRLQPHHGDTVRLQHARLTNIGVVATTAPVVLERVRMDSGYAHLATAGSRIADSHIINAGLPSLLPSLELGAGTIMERSIVEDSRGDGILISGASTITGCAVRRSAGIGIRAAAGARIEQCDLEGNAGPGVHAFTTDSIDATDSWWGDAAGPHGPAGDGVAGPVRYIPFRTAPYAFMRAALSRLLP